MTTEITNEQEAQAVRNILIEAYGLEEYLTMYNLAFWQMQQAKEQTKNEGEL